MGHSKSNKKNIKIVNRLVSSILVDPSSDFYLNPNVVTPCAPCTPAPLVTGTPAFLASPYVCNLTQVNADPAGTLVVSSGATLTDPQLVKFTPGFAKRKPLPIIGASLRVHYNGGTGDGHLLAFQADLCLAKNSKSCDGSVYFLPLFPILTPINQVDGPADPNFNFLEVQLEFGVNDCFYPRKVRVLSQYRKKKCSSSSSSSCSSSSSSCSSSSSSSCDSSSSSSCSSSSSSSCGGCKKRSCNKC